MGVTIWLNGPRPPRELANSCSPTCITMVYRVFLTIIYSPVKILKSA